MFKQTDGNNFRFRFWFSVSEDILACNKTYCEKLKALNEEVTVTKFQEKFIFIFNK